jgi:hypothetical protein
VLYAREGIIGSSLGNGSTERNSSCKFSCDRLSI